VGFSRCGSLYDTKTMHTDEVGESIYKLQNELFERVKNTSVPIKRVTKFAALLSTH
jgi:hypothetical protein